MFIVHPKNNTNLVRIYVVTIFALVCIGTCMYNILILTVINKKCKTTQKEIVQ